MLTDAQRAKIEPPCTGKTNAHEPTAGNRIFIKQCCDSPFRDLPREFGKWNSVFQRYCRWVKAGRFARIFAEISGEADRKYVMVDGSIVKVHRHGQGRKHR